MPMIHTSLIELERFGKLWDSWHDAGKPARTWFTWWCVGKPEIPDDKKIEEFKKSLTVQ